MSKITLDTSIVKYFAFYFAAVTLAVLIILYRSNLLRLLLHVRWTILPCGNRIQKLLLEEYRRRHDVIFFAKHSKLDVLRKAVQYVYQNELTSNTLTIVHFYENDQSAVPGLITNVALLDAMYPLLTVNLLLIRSAFSPVAIEQLSHMINVPKNYMFIRCPDTESPVTPAGLEGLRIIMQ